MISTKYAGLGDIKCLGLSVGSATERLLCLAYIEKRLMFLCAAKMISAPERDLKLLLGRLQYNAAGRCHSLRHRLREMRTAKVRIDGVPNEALAILLDEAVYGEESREVARIVWWLLFFFGCVLRSPVSVRISTSLMFLNRNEICHQDFRNLQMPPAE